MYGFQRPRRLSYRTSRLRQHAASLHKPRHSRASAGRRRSYEDATMIGRSYRHHSAGCPGFGMMGMRLIAGFSRALFISCASGRASRPMVDIAARHLRRPHMTMGMRARYAACQP